MNQTANFCKYCNKYFHFKDLYDQHEITCEFIFRTRRQKDREDDYIEKLPTPQEQFKLIQYLTLKVNRLENDVARLKINAGTRKRKLVLDILNNPTNPKPNMLFEEWIKIITLNEEDLYAVFSEDNTNGIISALNRCLTYNNIPICSFQQKDNSIYIWTTKFNNSEINEPIWIMLDYKVFQKWVLELNHKILCIFVKWKANNMEIIHSCEKEKDKFDQYMRKITGLSEKHEKKRTLYLHKWIYTKLARDIDMNSEYV